MWKQNSGSECKKFKPNIFNKNKCANCYRDKDQHSDEALEVNKATRIVAKDHKKTLMCIVRCQTGNCKSGENSKMILVISRNNCCRKKC